jgi:hypothetical protein
MTHIPSPSSAAQALGDVHAAAVEQGRKERLDNADGSWRCWGCDSEYPFDPSLHCQPCKAAGIARKRADERAERRLDDEQYRWRGMTRNMASDSRLDYDGALRLLEAAKRLPSKTSERIEALSAAFDKRFAAEVTPRGRSTWKYDEKGEGDWVR